jgi:hypothetical protein
VEHFCHHVGGAMIGPLPLKACCPYRVNFALLLQRPVAVIVEFFNRYGDGFLPEK